MTWLITSDTHFDDRPRNAYRFGLLPWLAQKQKLHGVTATFILGDLTQNKDNHSSSLVNRIIEELTALCPPVYILRGNHDGIRPDEPFFKFLNSIHRLRFIIKPEVEPQLRVGFIPHCQNQAEFDHACSILTPRLEAVLCHNLFEGALSESGTRLNGLQASPSGFKGVRRTYSGDVHSPQRCGPVTYVGAPYTINFGDTYTPRVILIKNGVESDLHFPAPRKWCLKINDPVDIEQNSELKPADQVKITLELAREEACEWAEQKQRVVAACKARGLEVFGVELTIKGAALRIQPKQAQQGRLPADVFNAFCQAEGIGTTVKKAGLELLA